MRESNRLHHLAAAGAPSLTAHATLLLYLLSALPFAQAACHRQLIYHFTHEGSNALCLATSRALGSYCIAEVLNDNMVRADRKEKLYRRFYCQGDTSKLVQPERWYRAGQGESHKASYVDPRVSPLRDVPCSKRNNSSVPIASILGLVRESQLDLLEKCLVEGAVPLLDVVILALTDLMRWSLAEYSEPAYKRNHSLYPQFQRGPAAGPSADLYEYNLDVLRETARGSVALWRKKVSRMNALFRAGLPVEHLRVVSYEQFLADPERTARWLGGPSKPAYTHRPVPEAVHDHVHKVRSNDIADSCGTRLRSSASSATPTQSLARLRAFSRRRPLRAGEKRRRG
jgi:hypothetical protein